MSAKGFIPLLRPILKKSTIDAAILSVEYSLSPEAKYPVALQEFLDVYHLSIWWATNISTDSKVSHCSKKNM